MNCPLGDQSTQATAAPCPFSVISLSSRAPITLARRDSEKNRELDECRILGDGVCWPEDAEGGGNGGHRRGSRVIGGQRAITKPSRRKIYYAITVLVCRYVFPAVGALGTFKPAARYTIRPRYSTASQRLSSKIRRFSAAAEAETSPKPRNSLPNAASRPNAG